jgi:putative spermidine/putrescine transport system ATP-binding protein
MNLIDGEVRNGRIMLAGLSVPAPIADGPATLAVRPEFLALSPSTDTDAPLAHRVIDYGTHLMVDIELKTGERLKAMTSPAEGWTTGARLNLMPRESAIYRDGVLAYRASPTAAAPMIAANG